MLDALRLGTHQLLSMRVPAHAAISTTVDLVRAPGRRGRGRLRQRGAAQGRRARPRRVGRAGSPPTRGLAGRARRRSRYSHPRWVVEELRDAVALAASSTTCWPPTTSRPGSRSWRGPVGPPATSCRASRRAYSPYGVVLEGGDPGAVPAVAEGRAGVQDEGSQLVAMALAAAPVDGRDETWLDLCAGPGGKAALLAALAGAARRPAGGERAAARTAPAWWPAPCAAPTACSGSSTGRRHRGAVPARRLRPGARRRALHRPGRAAPASGGPLAPPRRRPARPGARSSGRWWSRPSTWSAPVAWCSTPPARRCSPRPRAWSPPVLAGAARRRARGRRGPAAGRARLRRPAARHRPALAPPPRHRRHVPRPPPPRP